MSVRCRGALRALLAACVAFAPVVMPTPAAATEPTISLSSPQGCRWLQRGATSEVDVIVGESVSGAMRGVSVRVEAPEGITATVPTTPRDVWSSARFPVSLHVDGSFANRMVSITLSAVTADGVVATTSVQTWVLGPPASPVDVTGKPGDGVALVSWTPGGDAYPPVNGEAPALLHTIVASPGGATTRVVTNSDTSAYVAGLQNGTAYTFTVSVQNEQGSITSEPSPPVTPARVPRAPSAVQSTGEGRTRSVSWTPSTDSAAEVMGWSVRSHPATRTLTALPADTTVEFSGLDPDIAYEFSVRATSPSGDGHWGYTSTSTPGGPGVFDASFTYVDGVVAVHDTAEGILFYDVERFPHDAGQSTQEPVDPVRRVEATDAHEWRTAVPHAEPGTTQSVRVRAVSAAGVGEWSPPSESVVAPLEQTQNQVSTGFPVSRADSAWICVSTGHGDGSAVTGYAVVATEYTWAYGRRTCGSSRVLTLPRDARSAWLAGLTKGRSYQVTAYALTEHAPSAPVQAGCLGYWGVGFDFIGPPGAVRDVVAESRDGVASISWSVVDPAPNESYEVRVSPGGATVYSSSPSATVTGLTPGETYSFAVTAYNAAGDTRGTSSAVCVLCLPAAPTGVAVRVEAPTRGAAVVSWEAVTPPAGGGAVDYVLTPSGRPPVVVAATSATIALPDGTYTFDVAARNAAGTGPSTTSAPLTLDTTAPVVAATAAPPVDLDTRVGVSYSASGAPSTYDVRYRVAPWNGGFGAYRQPAAWQHTTATSVSMDRRTGWTYCFSVRARDVAGNVGPWTRDHCSTTPVDDRSLSDNSSRWSRGTSSSHYLGTYTATMTAGAHLTRTGVVARRLTLVAAKCSTCGTVRVYFNGALVRSVSLFSTRTSYRQLVPIDLGALRAGTVTITSLSGRAYVDGLAVSPV